MPLVERGKSGLWNIVYSMSGYGKTTLASGLMRHLLKTTGRKAMYVDFDASAEDIPLNVEFDNYQPTATDADRDAHDSALLCMENNNSAYVVDTVSMLGRKILLGLPKDSKDPRRIYMTAQEKIYQWAMRMTDLQRKGIHVLWLCHEAVAEIKDANDTIKEVKGGPEVVSSKLIKTIPAFARLTLRIDVIPSGATSVTRVIKTESDGIYVAKDRLNAFDPRGVPIGVSPYLPDGKTRKPPGQFENECLEMSEKVWRTIFAALARRQGVNGDPATNRPEEAVSTGDQKHG